MQFTASHFMDANVMSLHTGLQIGKVHELLVDPRKLVVVAFAVHSQLGHHTTAYLRINDIREVSNQGIIVDSHDELVELDDVVKLREVHDLNFHPIGLKVIDEKKHKLGTVRDYTLELGNMVIQQLVVQQPFFKSLREAELLIHRSQIVKLTNDTVTVRAASGTAEDPIPSAVRAYTNPFRKSTGQPATEPIEQKR